MESNGWITDRLPTKDDTDFDSMVWVWYEDLNSYSRNRYQDVIHGTPWQRIIKPEPYVKPRWKPKGGEEYWCIQSIQWPTAEGLCVRNHKWVNDTFDDNNYNSGNCFQTKEDAQQAFDKIKQLLKEHHDGK